MPYKEREKQKEYQRQRYLKNREACIEYAKKYQKENREHVNALERARYKRRGRINKKKEPSATLREPSATLREDAPPLQEMK